MKWNSLFYILIVDEEYDMHCWWCTLLWTYFENATGNALQTFLCSHISNCTLLARLHSLFNNNHSLIVVFDKRLEVFKYSTFDLRLVSKQTFFKYHLKVSWQLLKQQICLMSSIPYYNIQGEKSLSTALILNSTTMCELCPYVMYVLPQMPAQELLCCGAWREEEGSMVTTSSCPEELSEPERGETREGEGWRWNNNRLKKEERWKEASARGTHRDNVDVNKKGVFHFLSEIQQEHRSRSQWYYMK